MRLFRPLLAFVTWLTFAFCLYGDIPGDYNTNSTYSTGDIVIHSGISYQAQQDVPAGKTPSTEPSYWTSLDDLSGGQTDPGTPPSENPDADEVSGLSDPGTPSGSTSTTSRLINLSSRGYVGTRASNQHMIGGFGLSGSGTVKLFVRSLGPTLGALGVPGSLSNPKLTVKAFPSGTVTLENENWNSENSEWGEISDDYQPQAIGDSAAFITVSPGLYTTEVEGVGGLTGVGMIEIFTYDDLTTK